jgi:hypothetical protein
MCLIYLIVLLLIFLASDVAACEKFSKAYKVDSKQVLGYLTAHEGYQQ